MTDWKARQRKRIEKPLRRLRRTDGRPFVVIKDPSSGKFVQFIGSKTEPLLLDLPTAQILSEQEIAAAEALLGQPRLVKMGPRSPKAFKVFHAGPFEDACKAAEVAVDVMERVFRAAGNELEMEFGT